MPSQADDKFFGAKPGSSTRAYEELVRTYGLSKGTQVWHSMKADRMKAGKTWKPSR